MFSTENHGGLIEELGDGIALTLYAAIIGTGVLFVCAVLGFCWLIAQPDDTPESVQA